MRQTFKYCNDMQSASYERIQLLTLLRIESRIIILSYKNLKVKTSLKNHLLHYVFSTSVSPPTLETTFVDPSVTPACLCNQLSKNNAMCVWHWLTMTSCTCQVGWTDKKQYAHTGRFVKYFMIISVMELLLWSDTAEFQNKSYRFW